MEKEVWDNSNVDLSILRRKAYNMRWAEVEEGVLPLTAADPDYKAAPEIQQALIDYIKEGYFCYTPKLGYESFRKSLSKSLWDRKRETISPNLILPIDSAARGMDIIASAFLKKDEEAIIFDPVDFLFQTTVSLAGAKAVRYPCVLDEEGFIDLTDLEDYISEKTKMICLCNPHNPLGLCYREKDLKIILDLANKYDLYIMNDEIWSDIVYSDATFISLLNFPAHMNKKTITVTGFSKSFGLAGLRIGAVYCTEKAVFDQIVEASKVLTTIGGISSLSQVAGQAAVDHCYYWVDGFVKHLEKNRDYACERIHSMRMIQCQKPQATYVLFIDIRKTGLSSNEFVTFMKEKVKLALVPGSDEFFGPQSAGHVRLCFATSHEILEDGLNRLQKGLSML